MRTETIVQEVKIQTVLDAWVSEYKPRNGRKIVGRRSYIDPVKGVAVFVLEVKKPAPAAGSHKEEAAAQ